MSQRIASGEVANRMLKLLQDGAPKAIAALHAETGYARRQLSDAARQLNRRGLMIWTRSGVYQLNAKGREVAAEGLVMTSGPSGPTGARRFVADTFLERAWRAMRVRGQFTVPELVADAIRFEAAPESSLTRYLGRLCRAGYVIEMPYRRPGTRPGSNGFKVFRLLRNTGPRAPVYSGAANMLRDPNTGEDVPCARAR